MNLKVTLVQMYVQICILYIDTYFGLFKVIYPILGLFLFPVLGLLSLGFGVLIIPPLIDLLYDGASNDHKFSSDDDSDDESSSLPVVPLRIRVFTSDATISGSVAAIVSDAMASSELTRASRTTNSCRVSKIMQKSLHI